MPLKPLEPDEYWDVHIDWKRPLKYCDVISFGCNHDDNASLYHVLARYSEKPFKSLYIGRTCRQCVSVRLRQPDHKARYSSFQEEYSRHSFWVSCGIIRIQNGRLTNKRIKDIETVLIHTNPSEHAHNVVSVYKHGVFGSYRIENHGYRFGLPRELHLGFFVR